MIFSTGANLKRKTYQRSFKRVFTVALKANLARHHERLSDANCRNRSNEAHMKDFFEPRLKFPPHRWHRQLGYKIYSFCTHVCRGLAFADCLFVWLAPFGKMTICKLASRLAWLLCTYTVWYLYNGVCYVHCRQWEVGTMRLVICCVHCKQWDICIGTMISALRMELVCCMYMFIVYCSDLLICSMHWLGHNASCEGSSSFRWDRPDIHTTYTINYDVCTDCQLLYISALWIMMLRQTKIVCYWQLVAVAADSKLIKSRCHQGMIAAGDCDGMQLVQLPYSDVASQ